MSLDYATFGLLYENGVVYEAPPIAKFCVGKKIDEVRYYYYIQKGAKILSDSVDEDVSGFPPVQVSTFVKGDQFVFRGVSVEEVHQNVRDFGLKGNDFFEDLATFKQVALAKGVFTGHGSSAGREDMKPAPRKTTGSRAKDSAPPPDDVKFYEDGGEKWATGEGIDCEHGPRKDLRGNGYKADLYCSLNTQDFKKKCPPIKL